MSATSLFLRDGPVFKSGSGVLDEMTGVLDNAQVTLDVGQEDEFSISVPMGEAWLDDVKPGRIVHLSTRGEEYEWWVGKMDHSVDESAGAVVQIGLDPLHAILGSVGAIEQTTSGGVSYTNLGLEGSPKNLITTYVLPWLTTNSIDYFAAGTFDVSTRDLVTWDAATPLALIVKIAEKWGLEWRVRRDTVAEAYDIDFLTQIGSSATESWAAETLNILSLARERTVEDLRTVIRPLGALAAGSERRADIGQNVWRVSAKPSTDEVTVEALNGRAGPIGEDDQWVDKYLQLEDGSYEQIDDSVESTQTFTLADGSGVSVGDHMAIVRDSSGTLETEIESPSGVADFGRIQGPFETERRGERNWVKNPVFHDWDDPEPFCEPCQVAGGQATTSSVDLDGLPASFEIKQEDVFLYIGSGADDANAGPHRITADATANGSGEVTISISASITLTDNAVCLIYRATSVPDNWTRGPSSTGLSFPFRRPKVQHTDLTGAVDGAQTIGGTSKLTLDLKTLGADAELYVGDLIIGPSASTDRFWVVEDATANGSGSVTVNVAPDATGGGVALSDDDAVTVYRPLVRSDAPSDYMLCHARTNETAAIVDGRAELDSVEVTVNAIDGETVLWASVGFSAMAAGSVGWASTGDDQPPRLSLMSGASEDSGVDADDWSPTSAGETGFFTLRVSKDFTASANYGVRFTFPTWSNSGGTAPFDQESWVYPHWFMLHIGVDGEPPPVWGSHATDLVQDGNIVLAEKKQWGATYKVRIVDLAEIMSVRPSAIRPTLGGNIRIQHATAGVETLLRIVAMNFNPFHPEDMELILDRRPDLVTRRIRKQKVGKLFARLNAKATLASGEEITVEQTVIPDEDPPTVGGTLRAVAVTDAELTQDAALAVTAVPEDS